MFEVPVPFKPAVIFDRVANQLLIANALSLGQDQAYIVALEILSHRDVKFGELIADLRQVDAARRGCPSCSTTGCQLPPP